MKRNLRILLPYLSFLLTAIPACSQESAYKPDERAASLTSKLTTEEKIDLLAGSSMMSTHTIPRLSIPSFLMTDGPVGAHIPPPSTAIGGGIGLAASWDTELAHATGVQLGRDARARGANFLLGPGVNIYRTPLNGRNFEYFGEDPFLASRLTVNYINGVQSQGVSATVKHFMGNNSEYARHSTDSVIDEHTLREIYLPAFEAAVKEAHTGAVMCSYNLVNGIRMCENGPLLSGVLKNDLGFQGLVMSDWLATDNAKRSINNGLDLEMPFPLHYNKATLAPALADGSVKERTIDEHVERLLSTAARFGWLDRPQLDFSIPRFNLDADAVALRNAEEGIVLLKNNGLLPLRTDRVKRIAVLGQDAFPAVPSAGGSGYVQSFHSVSLLEGIGLRFPKASVSYIRGVKNINILAIETPFHVDSELSRRGVTVETFDSAFTGSPKSKRNEASMTLGSSFNSDPEGKPDYSTWTLGDLAALMPKEDAYQRWTGYLKVETPGRYYAFVQTGSPFQLSVDDRVLVDNSQIAKAALNQVQIDLDPGVHKMEVRLFGGGDFGGATLRAGLVSKEHIVDPLALELAKNADVVIVGAGFNSDNETEGSDRGFDLPVGQDDLIHEAASVNKNTIVAITSGGSVNLPWLSEVAGVFALWYPGQEGGKAFAELMAGDLSPSGRLPISWEKNLADNPSIDHYWYTDSKTKQVPYSEGVFVGYRGFDKNHKEPLFPFGFGLSYSTFSYHDLKARQSGGTVTVTAVVKNTGTVAAAEVVQLYVSDPNAASDNAAQELKGFTRTVLAPREERTVTFVLDARSFAHFDVATQRWIAKPGPRLIRLGANERSILAEVSVNIPQLTATK